MSTKLDKIKSTNNPDGVLDKYGANLTFTALWDFNIGESNVVEHSS